MHNVRQRLSDDVLENVLALPWVRPDVVARARALRDVPCRAEEIASELVDCYVAQRLP